MNILSHSLYVIFADSFFRAGAQGVGMERAAEGDAIWACLIMKTGPHG